MPSREWWETLPRPTIEPVVILFAYAASMHSTVIQQYIYKRVSDTKGFTYSMSSKGSCNNETLNSTLQELEKEVQSLSSYIHLGTTIFGSIPSLVTALFIGAWTDMVGRRPALVLPCFGSAIDSLIVLLVMYFKWPIFVLFAGSAIRGMCGFITVMLLAVVSYVADTTDESNRTFRLAVVECFAFTGGMISHLTSGLWIENVGFIAAYWFTFVLLLASILYVIFFVHESRASSCEHRSLCKLFSLTSVKRVWQVFKNPRNGARRNLILFALSSFVIITTYLGVGGVVVLFVLHSPLCFSAKEVGYYLAFQDLLRGAGAVLGIKLLGKCLNEVNIVRAGIFSQAVAIIVLGFSRPSWLVYMSPVAGILSTVALPIFRGMMSRTVGADEQGAMFSAIASLETVCDFLGAFTFNSMYPASLTFQFPPFVFFFGTLMLILPLLFTCCLRNPASFLPKKEMYGSTQHDNMEDNLLSTSGPSNMTTTDGYEILA